MNNKKALIAMSGGVDSSVTAHLVKAAGYYTEGVTMRLWNEGESIADSDVTLPDQNCIDAFAAASRLGIPHRSIALGESFKKAVIDNFLHEYICGNTPNPCVMCNKHIKFGALMELTERYGFDCLATGHYARIEQADNGEYLLKKAKDSKKDQSYFLWSIKKEYLSRILFPLGDYTKPEIRKIAEDLQLESAHRSDSQDICFIPNGDYASFIASYTNEGFREGDFISPDGRILGKHSGIVNYTVGQRKGLGISLGEPVFVCKKDIEKNTVTLCSDKELYGNTLTAHSVNILKNDALNIPKCYDVKIRYRHAPTPALVTLTNDGKLQICFEEPQRAITPGQSVVIYDGDILIGGGIID